MNISKKWLEKFVPTVADLDDAYMANKLTQSLAEVEGITDYSKGLEKLVCGQIKEIKKHKKSNKLSICQVDIGGDTLQIVCGAPNVEVNANVVVCLPGGSVLDAKTGKKFEIKKANIRGVESNGMICSEKELGISDNHKGILILPQSTKVGSEIDDLIRDSIFEIENKSLTHRGDCFSHYGIAREISAIFDLDLAPREKESEPVVTEALPIEVRVETKKCKRFAVITIKGIEVKESPFWLKLALSRIGVRPINNIVDVTNYLMHSWGQPLHAYDYRKIKANKLIIREARSGEKYTAIDHNEYTLNEGDIVVADSHEVHDLAGIMGGASSEISQETQDIVIEAGNFSPEQVLKTSRRQGIRSEAGVRFSKNVDLAQTLDVLKTAANLIQDLAGGDIGSEILDVYPEKEKKIQVEFDLQQINKTIGIDLETEKIAVYLERLGIEITNKNELNPGKQMVGIPIKVKVDIPSWRHDLNIAEDIVEEVARINGYENITPTLPLRKLNAQNLPAIPRLHREARKFSLRLGYSEVITYSFISERLKELFKIKDRQVIKVLHAISPELKYVRNSLLPSLVEAFEKNYKNFPEPKLFELGRTIDNYNYTEEKIPGQPWKLGLLTAKQVNGRDNVKAAQIDSKGKNQKNTKEYVDNNSHNAYLQAKAEFEQLLNRLGVVEQDLTWTKPSSNELVFVREALHPERMSVLKIKNEAVGWYGEVHPGIVKEIASLDYKLFSAQVDLEKLIEINALHQSLFTNISQLPAVKRDISMFIKDQENLGDVARYIKGYSKLPADTKITAELIDEYFTEKGKRSVTFSIALQPHKETLTDKQATKTIENLSKDLSREFRVKVRE